MTLGAKIRCTVAMLSAVALSCKDDADPPAMDTGTETAGDDESTSSTTAPMGDSTTGPENLCGNGTMDPGEACDDGNGINSDGCNADCTISETIEFERIWDSSRADCAEGVAVDSQGNVIAVGYVDTDVKGFDILVLKLDPSLNDVWTALHDGPVSGDDRARGVAVGPDDSIVVVGFIAGDATAADEIWVRKYSDDGDEVWSDTVPGLAEQQADGAFGVKVLSDGSVVVVGEIVNADLNKDAWIRKYKSNGDVDWTVTYDGPSMLDDSARGVSIGPGDEIYVTGWITGGTENGRRIWTARLSADGSFDWETTYSAGYANGNVGNGLGVRSDLAVVVTGSQRASGRAPTDAWTGAYDADGGELWSMPFAGIGGGADLGYGVGIGSDDTATVVGKSIAFGQVSAFFIHKYDQSGALQWNQEFGGMTKSEAEARAVAIDPTNDHIVVAGCQAAAGDITSGDVYIVKMTP